jgi:hypothetical protein
VTRGRRQRHWPGQVIHSRQTPTRRNRAATAFFMVANDVEATECRGGVVSVWSRPTCQSLTDSGGFGTIALSRPRLGWRSSPLENLAEVREPGWGRRVCVPAAPVPPIATPLPRRIAPRGTTSSLVDVQVVPHRRSGRNPARPRRPRHPGALPPFRQGLGTQDATMSGAPRASLGTDDETTRRPMGRPP